MMMPSSPISIITNIINYHYHQLAWSKNQPENHHQRSWLLAELLYVSFLINLPPRNHLQPSPAILWKVLLDSPDLGELSRSPLPSHPLGHLSDSHWGGRHWLVWTPCMYLMFSGDNSKPSSRRTSIVLVCPQGFAFRMGGPSKHCTEEKD